MFCCLRESQKVFSISDFNTHKRTKHGLLPNIRSVKDSKQNLYNTYVTWNKLSGWDFGDAITSILLSSCKNEMDVLIRLKTETSQASSKPSFKVPLSLLYIYIAKEIQSRKSANTGCRQHLWCSCIFSKFYFSPSNNR